MSFDFHFIAYQIQLVYSDILWDTSVQMWYLATKTPQLDCQTTIMWLQERNREQWLISIFNVLVFLVYSVPIHNIGKANKKRF